MTDIPQGWATIDAAIIGVFGAALLAMLGVVLRRLKRVRQDTATTVFHVANEHRDEQGDPINLRDDNDEKHAETMRELGKLGARLKTVERDVGGMRAELRTLHENDTEHVRQVNRNRERIDELARIVPRGQLERPTEG